MPNPYAPTGRRRSAPQRTTDLDGFVARLRGLGAPDDVVGAVTEAWDSFDQDGPLDTEAWTPERQQALVAMSDDDLRAMFGAAPPADASDVEADAYDRMGSTVGDLLEWVGDDRERAAAVLRWETSPEGGNRKTLVEPLDALLADPGTPGPDGGQEAGSGAHSG